MSKIISKIYHIRKYDNIDKFIDRKDQYAINFDTDKQNTKRDFEDGPLKLKP